MPTREKSCNTNFGEQQNMLKIKISVFIRTRVKIICSLFVICTNIDTIPYKQVSYREATRLNSGLVSSACM